MSDFKKRCEDCACLVIKNGKWYCDECFGCPIEEVDDCPEGITAENATELDDKVKKVKIDHGAREKTENKPKKPKTVKISNEKQELFTDLLDFLSTKYKIDVETPNKLVKIYINDKEFKLNLSETRKKKA